MVTMDQVAARAKVSQATVSHVLGGKADQNKISQQTRDRVLEVAQELGYHRNLIARSMVTGKSRTIGLLTTLQVRETVVQMLAGATEATNEHDYLLKVMHMAYDKVDTTTVTRCLEWRLAGVMVAGLTEDPQRRLHDEFQRARVPLVLVDSAVLPEWGARFVSDDGFGIRQAVLHLIGLGHRRIAFLGGRSSELSERREKSFRATVGEAGLSLPDKWVRNAAWGEYDIIAKAAHELLREDRPTAIVCSGDMIAMVVLRVARALRLRLPADLSVTGYSNAELSAFADPPLTTVYQPFQAMGYAAAKHLIQCAESDNPNLSIGSRPEVVLPTRLIERESTGPPRLRRTTRKDIGS